MSGFLRRPAVCVILILLFAACASADVLTVRQNLDKYWLYRQKDRTDFIIPGVGQGYSMPANTRNNDTHLIWFGDATIDLGWYIGALATEHYMMTHPEFFPGYATGGGDLTTVRNELCWAIMAMDRVDSTAETCWSPTAPDTPGFFIRDDVPASFISHFPGITTLGSDYTNPDVWAKEMSQDQVCHVLIGLALVKKLIPSDLVVNGINLRQHAITRGSNIVDWVHQAGWIIKNPVLGTDVVRGPDARAYGTGFNKSCVFLTDGAVDFGGSISGLYSWMWGTLSAQSNPAYDNANNQHMAMAIAACGNGWGDNDTLDDLMGLSVRHEWYAYPLLYATLYDSIAHSRLDWSTHQQTMRTIVQNQLNHAPSSSTPHHPNSPEELNTGWGSSRKFIRGLGTANEGEGAPGDQWPGLDYLLLHNLFYIVNPTVWQNPTPPGQASNPSPADGAVGVSPNNPALSWVWSALATSHDIYLGTTNPPPFRQNQTGNTYNAGALSDDSLYYWRIDQKNAVGTTVGTVWSFRTCGTPPARVTSFAVTGTNFRNTLTWTNPTSDFVGTRILYKTLGYPTSPTDGTVLYNGTAATCIHTGLFSGYTYCYAAYAYDAALNYSAPATVMLICPSPYWYADDFTYPSPTNLLGNGLWTNGNSGSEIQSWIGGTAKINGGSTNSECYANFWPPLGSDAISLRIQIRKGYGTSTLWSFRADDGSGSNLARWYGTGSTVRGRIGDSGLVTTEKNLTGLGIWDNLEAKISSATGQTEFFFNGSSIGTLSHSGAMNGIYRLKFERIYNSTAGEYIYLDNLTIADDAPPSPPRSFAVIVGNHCNNLMWEKPPDSDLAGTKIMYKTTGYPTSLSDGTQCYNGNGINYTHTGLTNGTTYYYSAFAYDTLSYYSTKVDASGVPIYFDARQAKLAANNTGLSLTSGVVSAVFPGCFYVQNEDSPGLLPIGIRVNKTFYGLSAGQCIGVQGNAMTDPATGEKFVSAWWVQPFGSGTITPMAMGNNSVGGAPFSYNSGNGAGQAGIANGRGPNNIGLLVTIYGKVTQRHAVDPMYFYIDDGSGLKDGTTTGSVENTGVRIIADPASYAEGSYTVVKGISSCFLSSGLRPRILATDIQVLQAP